MDSRSYDDSFPVGLALCALAIRDRDYVTVFSRECFAQHPSRKVDSPGRIRLNFCQIVTQISKSVRNAVGEVNRILIMRKLVGER